MVTSAKGFELLVLDQFIVALFCNLLILSHEGFYVQYLVALSMLRNEKKKKNSMWHYF